ncbi:unnamed protein product, partial [Porites evermanni]
MSSENRPGSFLFVPDVKSAEKVLHEHELDTTTSFVMYYNIGLGKVQKQKGYNDCALFAITFATTLCHGGDPTTKRYDQRAMRPHLVDCLESSRMTEFPPTDDTVELVHPVVGKNV